MRACRVSALSRQLPRAKQARAQLSSAPLGMVGGERSAGECAGAFSQQAGLACLRSQQPATLRTQIMRASMALLEAAARPCAPPGAAARPRCSAAAPRVCARAAAPRLHAAPLALARAAPRRARTRCAAAEADVAFSESNGDSGGASVSASASADADWSFPAPSAAEADAQRAQLKRRLLGACAPTHACAAALSPRTALSPRIRFRRHFRACPSALSAQTELAAVTARGVAADFTQRVDIEDVILQLEALNPSAADPSAALDGASALASLRLHSRLHPRSHSR
jgi:hypothetical protein